MHYTIDQGNDVVRAELFGRQTAEQTQEFIEAVAAEVARNGCTRVLVCVRNSRPIFKVERHRIDEQFRRLAAKPAYRVAVLGDSDELRASHEYIEVLARQQGANLRAFRDEPAALDWLGAAQSHEKR